MILLAAGVWIYQIISEYQKAEREYEQLQEYVKVEKNTRIRKIRNQMLQKMIRRRKAGRNCNGGFASLQAINPDIVAWLIPGCWNIQ